MTLSTWRYGYTVGGREGRGGGREGGREGGGREGGREEGGREGGQQQLELARSGGYH